MRTDYKNWHVATKDRKTIEQIAKRAQRTLGAQGLRIDWDSIRIDLTLCHANGCPLRLMDLLNADDLHLMSDVLGVLNHIDGETGKLDGGFVPRFAAQQGGEAGA
ncbi:MAG: hypothetical protein HYV27_15190 [Candidatus Hydrogenedentes bacterium]|nr:hypothetical protein [Candidatus Hydrogenedentota bacterium]